MARRRPPRGRPPETSDVTDHLAFVRQWRRVLRLPLNATEALLVDGTRKDADPGVLKHLLSKIDRSAIEQALARQPLSDDPAQRARFLAGAAGVTNDAGILLDALEAQHAVASRADVARAFSRAIQQLDLSRLSHARLARLLGLIDEVLPPAEQLATAFALLRKDAFRTALHKATDRLPETTAQRWLPLEAVHASLAGEEASPDLLERGLAMLLDAPPAVLDRQPNRIRFGVVTTALNLDATWPLNSPAIDRIVEGLDPEDVAWAGLAFNRAAGQIRAGRYASASALLDRILEHHPEDLRATVLLSQLAAPRRGPLALPDSRPGALRRGYALSLLEPVLVRTDADRDAIALHRELDLPGIAPLLLSDADGPTPWFAVHGGLSVLEPAAGMDRTAALQTALGGARIAALLERLGLIVPDLYPDRFVVDISMNRRWLELADLTGARREPEVASAHMRTLAAWFTRAALSERPFQRSPVRGDLRQSTSMRLEQQLREPLPISELIRWITDLG